jgi:hypothetical protein
MGPASKWTGTEQPGNADAILALTQAKPEPGPAQATTISLRPLAEHLT